MARDNLLSPRAITDLATYAYVSDVIVLEDRAGEGSARG
jgi:hypothetical protein